MINGLVTILSETPVTPTDVGTMFTGIDFSTVMGQILSSAPVLVPVVVACKVPPSLLAHRPW